MRAGLLIRVAAACGAVTVVTMPAGRGLPLANVANRQRRDCPPELVVRREYSVIPIPLVVAVERDVGVAGREDAAGIGVFVFGGAVAFGVVRISVGAIEDEAVAGARLSAAARAIARVVVGVGLAGEAGGRELVGGIERKGARTLWRRHRLNPASGIVGVAVGDARAGGGGMRNAPQPPGEVVCVGCAADRLLGAPGCVAIDPFSFPVSIRAMNSTVPKGVPVVCNRSDGDSLAELSCRSRSARLCPSAGQRHSAASAADEGLAAVAMRDSGSALTYGVSP